MTAGTHPRGEVTAPALRGVSPGRDSCALMEVNWLRQTG